MVTIWFVRETRHLIRVGKLDEIWRVWMVLCWHEGRLDEEEEKSKKGGRL